MTWLKQSLHDIPRTETWLSTHERRTCNAFKFPKRRQDWLLGRWTAKSALASRFAVTGSAEGLRTFEIRPAEDGAPEVFRGNQSVPVSISISHSNGCGFCAIGPRWKPVGCDVESLAKRSDGFIRDYFTAAEQEQVFAASGAHRALLATLIWSAKESTLKALRLGLRLDTRAVEVFSDMIIPNNDDWTPFRTCFRNDKRTFDGWYRADRDFVFTMVTETSD
jgi:4'-phosphopantetheinyl transferase